MVSAQMVSVEAAEGVGVRGEPGGERAAWVRPDFDELATAPEVSAYAGGR
jgi:hypothetical protein